MFQVRILGGLTGITFKKKINVIMIKMFQSSRGYWVKFQQGKLGPSQIIHDFFFLPRIKCWKNKEVGKIIVLSSLWALCVHKKYLLNTNTTMYTKLHKSWNADSVICYTSGISFTTLKQANESNCLVTLPIHSVPFPFPVLLFFFFLLFAFVCVHRYSLSGQIVWLHSDSWDISAVWFCYKGIPIKN